MLYRISRALICLILKVFFHLEVKGAEYIPKKGGFILASNHVSYFDPLVVGVACPHELNFMARHDLFSNPLFSWWLYGVDVIPVKRGSVDISAVKEAIRRLKDGQGLVIFPEGARQSGPALGPAESGIGFLVAKTGVPVIPVFVKGTELVLPKGAKFIRFHKISAYFGKQISIERRMPYQDIADEIMENIRHLSC